MGNTIQADLPDVSSVEMLIHYTPLQSFIIAWSTIVKKLIVM